MNKLLKPALMAFSAVLTTVLISCSGSDGKKGDDGQTGAWTGCTTVLDGDDVVVKCGDVTVGTLTPGATGPDGARGDRGPFCTATPTAEGYSIACPGSPTITIKGGGGGSGGNCLLQDTENLLTIHCNNTKNFRLTLCGSGTTGWYEGTYQGAGPTRSTFNENTHFCSSDFAVDASGNKKEDFTNISCEITGANAGQKCNEKILARCGAPKSGGEAGEAYDPTTRYCARNLIAELTRTVDGEDIDSDAIEEAGLWDVDVEKPWSDNWRVLTKGQCFSSNITGSDAVKSCNAYGATATLNDYKAAVVAGSSSSNVAISIKPITTGTDIKFCPKEYFFNRTLNKCTLVETTNPDLAAGQCRSLSSVDNTCYSDENPTGVSNILVRSCFPLLGDITEPSRAAKKVWYDARNVASCNSARRTLTSALSCNTPVSKQVSTWQAMPADIWTIITSRQSGGTTTEADSLKLINWLGIALPQGSSAINDWITDTWGASGFPAARPGRDGTVYTKKVSCYDSKVPTDCGSKISEYFTANPSLTPPAANAVSYITNINSNQFGSCVLATGSRVCPGGTGNSAYKPVTRDTLNRVCYNWLNSLAPTAKVGAGTFQEVLDKFMGFSDPDPDATGIGTTYEQARAVFATRFALACSDSLAGRSDNANTNPTTVTVNKQNTDYFCQASDYWGTQPSANVVATASTRGIWSLDLALSAWGVDNDTRDVFVAICNHVRGFVNSTQDYCMLRTANAENVCYPGSRRDDTDHNKCVLTDKGVPAPLSGYGEGNVRYTANDDFSWFTAPASELMCPHNDYDETTGYCAVDPNLKTPECFNGYTRSPGNERCLYTPGNDDCPFGYTWHSTDLICKRAGQTDLHARCPHDLLNATSNDYYVTLGITASSTPAQIAAAAPFKGVCVETITRKHCPKGTELVFPIDRWTNTAFSAITDTDRQDSIKKPTVDNPILCDYTTKGGDPTSGGLPTPLPGFGSNSASGASKQNNYPAPKPDCLIGEYRDDFKLSFDMYDANTALTTTVKKYVCRVELKNSLEGTTPATENNGNGNALCATKLPSKDEDGNSISKVASYTRPVVASGNTPASVGACVLTYNTVGSTSEQASITCPSGGTYTVGKSNISGGSTFSNVDFFWQRCQIDLSSTSTVYCPVQGISAYKSECFIEKCVVSGIDQEFARRMQSVTFDPSHVGVGNSNSDCTLDNAVKEGAITQEEADKCTTGSLVSPRTNRALCTLASAYNSPACASDAKPNPFTKRCESL